jgi:uncharacterized protein YjdB
MKKSLFPSALAGSVLLALILSSCPPPTGSAVLVNSITLSPKTLTLDVGQTQTITSTVLPDNADNPALSWSSDTPNAATVDQNGTVTAVAPGTANITATAADGSGISASSRVTVRAPVLVESISLKPATLTLVLGQNAIGTFTPTILPETASNKAVVWSSDTPTVATVDENGIVTAVAVGSATITATAADGSGISASATVTVAESPFPVIPVTSVAVSPPALALELGGTATGTLSAAVQPDTATNRAVLWNSDRPTVAAVDPDTGVVTAVSVGTATITATAKDGSGKRGTATVTVSEIVIPVESVTVSPKTLALVLGETETGTLSAAVAPDSASNKAVLWSSSDPTVASVSQSGVVTAVSVGTATITATAAGGSEKSDTAEVTVSLPAGVTDQVSSIAISGTPTTIVHHATVTLSKTVLPAGAYQEVTWASSNSGVASVSQAGVVTGTGVGTADITAKAKDGTNKVSNTWTVTVTPLAVSSVAVSPLSLMVGTTGTPTFSVLPANASNKGLTWSSDDTAVAAVHPSTGLVTAVSLGTANITATAVDGSGKSGSAVVTVTENVIPVSSVNVSPPTLALVLGETATGTLSAAVLPANAGNKAVAWSSSDPAVATVSQSGVVTAVSVGTANITATAQDGSEKSGSAEVTVTESSSPVPVSSVSVSPLSLNVGATGTPTFSVLPTNASNKGLTWSSDNSTVATVHPSTGLVTGVAAGTATITATAQDGSGKSDTATVTVTESSSPVPVSSVSVSPSSLDLVLGGTATGTLSATVLPANAGNKAVAWSSDTPDVATVSQSGVVTAVSEGSAVITATAQDGSEKSGSAEVTVSSDETSVVIAFTEFGDEEIHFSQNSGLILYRHINIPVTVTVTGDWVSCAWFEDGQQTWNGFSFEINAGNYPAQTEHTLTAVVAKGNKYYSKTLTFKVLP